MVFLINSNVNSFTPIIREYIIPSAKSQELQHNSWLGHNLKIRAYYNTNSIAIKKQYITTPSFSLRSARLS